MAELIYRDLSIPAEPTRPRLRREPLGQSPIEPLDLSETVVSLVKPFGQATDRSPRTWNDARSGGDDQQPILDTYRVAGIERQALTEMLKQWWAWLDRP